MNTEVTSELKELILVSLAEGFFLCVKYFLACVLPFAESWLGYCVYKSSLNRSQTGCWVLVGNQEMGDSN